ncbi:SNF2-related protein [Tissierellaceae bacterium HCP3S3_D8]
MTLYSHQKKVLEETKNYNKVAYYLDMGLGKTFVGSEKMKELNTNHNLVICQKSKISDWYEHFKTYYDYNIIVYNKPVEIPNNSVVIINYDLVWRRPELMELEDFTLMLDESSMAKNEKAKRTKFIMKMKAKNVILLSGTPTGGKYEELWSQCRLLGWNINKTTYWDHYIKTITQDIGGFPLKIVVGYKNVDRLKKKLRHHGAIFMKTEEVFDLPEQIHNEVKIKNTKEYTKFKKDRIIKIEDQELVGDTTLTKMLYERQLCGQYNKNKLSALEDLLESTEDRVVIFYNFNEEYRQIKELCKKLNKPVSTINGSIKDLKDFKDKSNTITLVQYQAGAMGHNLQLANKQIYYTLPLSSELFEQSKKRIHRIGQDRSCFYWYLIIEKSIEEKIFETLKLRKDFTDKLFEEGEV